MRRKPFKPPREMPHRSVHRVLAGQKALVTGASKGVGEGIAVALAQAGADVMVNYWSDEKGAERVASAVRDAGVRGLVRRADVSREEQVRGMFDALLAEWGRLDILVNNAGIQMNAAFDAMSLAQWQRVIDVNLTGYFLCSREAVRIFKGQSIDSSISCALGKIIFISSVHDVIPWEGHVNYAAAKGGVMLLMKSLAQEVSHLKIRVNGLSPGAIRTPMNEEKLVSRESYRELLELIPYKRIGEIEDCGRAAVWLASDDSDYVQGTTLYLDGGMTLYPGFIGGG